MELYIQREGGKGEQTRVLKEKFPTTSPQIWYLNQCTRSENPSPSMEAKP